MRRTVLAIFGFGTVAALFVTVALSWAAESPVFERPALRFHVSLSVTL